MTTTLSATGRVMLPAVARRKLQLAPGERLSVELREGGVLLRPKRRPARYESQLHPVSGLPCMVAKTGRARKVSPGEIARIQAELP